MNRVVTTADIQQQIKTAKLQTARLINQAVICALELLACAQ